METPGRRAAGQGVHVALVVALVELEKVPPPHCTGGAKGEGQKLPAGQAAGKPPAHVAPAQPAVQLRLRSRLFALSSTKNTPRSAASATPAAR